MGFILLSAGGKLVEGKSPTAVLVTLGLLGMRYRRRFRRMFGKASGASGSFDDEDFEEPEKTDNTDMTVAVLEEPASPHTIDTAEEWAHIARPAPQFTASENGSGVTASERAGGTDPAASLREEAKASASRNGDHSDTSGATTNESGNLSEPKKKKSRRWGRRIRRTIWAAVAAGAVFGLVHGHAELRVAGPVHALPIANPDVRAPVH